MKNLTKTGIIILLCVCPILQSFGQDTLSHHTARKDYQINARYRDRTMALSIDAIGGSMRNNRNSLQYGLGTAVEFKIRDYHSLGGGVNIWRSDNWYDLFGYYSSKNCLQVELEYRYYHNLRNRMSKGLTGNNFSANYFLFSPGGYLQIKRKHLEDYYWDFSQGIWVLEYTRSLVIRPDIRIGYGIQRTFWRNLKVDINGGIQFRKGIDSFRPLELLYDMYYIQFSLGYIIK
jgi:hypothetical protein